MTSNDAVVAVTDASTTIAKREKPFEYMNRAVHSPYLLDYACHEVVIQRSIFERKKMTLSH